MHSHSHEHMHAALTDPLACMHTAFAHARTMLPSTNERHVCTGAGTVDRGPEAMGSRVVLVLLCTPFRHMQLGMILGVLLRWAVPWNLAFIERLRIKDAEFPIGYISGMSDCTCMCT